ncbi:MAG: DUF4337 family protein [Nocardioides sp.]
MADVFTEMPAEKADSRTTLYAAILLGIAATCTAISAYQAALLDGETLEKYTDANAGLTASSFIAATTLQTYTGDQVIFREYSTALFENKRGLAAYTYEQMSPNLQEAVDWWIESDDTVTSAFDDVEGNPYVGNDLSEVNDLADEADAAREAGAQADERGDQFELASVLFALTLFFGGIATLFSRRSFTLTLLTFATVGLVAGSLQLATAFAT